MDSPQPTSRSARFKRTGITIAATTALLVIVIFAAINRSANSTSKNTFAWLNPAQFGPQVRPGRIKLVYYKVLSFTATLWQRFRKPKTQIHIASKMLALRGVSPDQLGMGTPASTNENGMQAWILSPAALDSLSERLRKMDGVEILGSPAVLTVDGMRAQVQIGKSYMISPPPAVFVPIGMVVDVNPKVSAHEFRLTVQALHTQTAQTAERGESIVIRTNLSAACSVNVPNTGGLVITGPPTRDPNKTNYWFILSPTAVDPAGNAIKL
jgi:hypothetical protein